MKQGIRVTRSTVKLEEIFIDNQNTLLEDILPSLFKNFKESLKNENVRFRITLADSEKFYFALPIFKASPHSHRFQNCCICFLSSLQSYGIEFFAKLNGQKVKIRF